MVHGALKSRRLRRIAVKLPTGNKITYRQRNRKPSVCAITKKPLQGLPRLTNRRYKNLNKSQKTVARPYGGYMSAAALKIKIIKEMILDKD